MKNPSITAAFVLVALALVVGGVALSTGGGPDVAPDAVLPAVAGTQEVSFANLTPHEMRKKGRMEAAQRELEKVKKIGKEVAPNVFKVKDDTGDPTYYYGSLIKGVGRNGEPLYLSAEFKRLPAVPLKELPTLPPKLQPKLKTEPIKGALKFNKKNAGGKGGDGGAGGAGDGGDQSGAEGKGPGLGGSTGGG